MLSSLEMKKLAGAKAAQLVQEGMIVGLGSGSTAYWLITELGKRNQREDLRITAVPTSRETEKLATQLGIGCTTLNNVDKIDIAIDGADEIDPQWQLIKGGGGALLQEKMVAAFSEKLVIIADHTKLVPHLGRFPLGIEVIPYGWKIIAGKLQQQYGVNVSLRQKNNGPFVTDHGHYILDAAFGSIEDPVALDQQLHSIPGIVETGLFIDMVDEVIIAYPDGKVTRSAS
jgi:ribose 5-phosphate isomerase